MGYPAGPGHKGARKGGRRVDGGIAALPAYLVGNVDDVFIARQHQVFLRLGGDVGLADLLDVDLFDTVDGSRQGNADTRRERVDIAAEARHDPAFLRRDAMDRGEQQQHEHQRDDRPDDEAARRQGRKAGAAASPAPAEARAILVQPFIEAGDVRRLAASRGRRGARAPRPVAAAISAGARTTAFAAAGPASRRSPRSLAVTEERPPAPT